MLSHLQIRDFVIVDELDLALSDGMTALTGETGAGKSILIDALGLTLGERGDGGMIRAGADRAEVVAIFDVGACGDAREWLAENGLESDGECILRRVLNRDSRSRSYINGSSVALQQLRALGDRLVDVHGQHDHQSLLRAAAQRSMLDDFAGNRDTLSELREIHDRWRTSSSALEELSAATRERQERLELLRFQVEELDAAALSAGEVPQLEDEHRRLANAGRLIASCQRILEVLYEGDGAVQGLVQQSEAELRQLAEIDSRLAQLPEMLEQASIQVQETSNELRRYVADVDLDPQRLDQVEQRFATLHHLARKHRCNSEDLAGLLDRLRSDLNDLENADTRLESLAAEVRDARKRFDACAIKLSKRRRQAAETLSAAVTEAMQTLAMKGGQFRVEVVFDDSAPPNWNGFDRIEYLVAANPGQALQPLNRVASGGELSRIGLAIQVSNTRSVRMPTLIFDEVDSGIGGGTAEVVGRLLRSLGAGHQVLCVTHLPQVAAQAHHHLRVRKRSDGQGAETEVRPLQSGDRIDEVARMLGGLRLTENTVAHAREMIEQAQAG